MTAHAPKVFIFKTLLLCLLRQAECIPHDPPSHLLSEGYGNQAAFPLAQTLLQTIAMQKKSSSKAIPMCLSSVEKVAFLSLCRTLSKNMSRKFNKKNKSRYTSPFHSGMALDLSILQGSAQILCRRLRVDVHFIFSLHGLRRSGDRLLLFGG